MDRVNISVAVIPMAETTGWTPTQAGLIQSAFFYGYSSRSSPGGWLANKFGGEKVLPFGVFLGAAPPIFSTAPPKQKLTHSRLSHLAVSLAVGRLSFFLFHCEKKLVGGHFAGPLFWRETSAPYTSPRAAVGLGEGISLPPRWTSLQSAFRQREVEGDHVRLWLHARRDDLWAAGGATPDQGARGLSVFVAFGAVGVVWCIWFERFFSPNRSGWMRICKLWGSGG